VRLLGRVTDEELVALYRGALAYVDATLYEGFGYQVLEAMACGAPVVASSLTSIPEVVGNAGILCDPRDAEALAAALQRVLDDPDEAAGMRERGFARAATFTWERTGAAFGAVLDDVLRSGAQSEATRR
jgi:glycosyltransferase involved in cell wall biosynthesis